MLASAVGAVPVVAQGEGSAPYPDTPVDGYFAEPVRVLAEAGVFVGTECERGFCPHEPIDRATMAVWTVRVLDGAEPPEVASTRFADVDSSHAHAAFVERFAQLGVTKGCMDGTVFCPDAAVTRAQMAVFLSRAFGLPEGPDPGFGDVSVGAWYVSAVSALAASGVTKGCMDGTVFCPDGTTTRAQMATFLYRAGQLRPTDIAQPRAGVFTAVSAGRFHSCGVRVDGTLECWGANNTGQSDAPAGQFIAVSAGGFHSCGVRVDGTLECWGSTTAGTSDAPAGRFTAVAAGSSHSCGVRVDGTLECWGGNWLGQADAPDGRFGAVDGSDHTCGLRTDGRIECWGNNWIGQADAPGGRFGAVAVGGNHSCGLRVDGTIECWGQSVGKSDAPDGRFTAVAAGGSHSCGVRADQTIECWGNPWRGQLNVPDGGFSAVAVGGSHSCGLRVDGTVECWGAGYVGQASSPDGVFVAVAAGVAHSCGIGVDQRAVCWGLNDYGQAWAPYGRFTSVSAGERHSCGIRTDKTVLCWGGRHGYGEEAGAPSGRFTAVSAGGSHSCGLGVDGTVRCWGANNSGQLNAPAGRFTAVSAGGSHSCGLGVDGTVRCWGDDRVGKLEAPSGRFGSVAAGQSHSCGVRTDQTIECWGGNSFGQTDAPDGVFAAVAAGERHSCGLRVNQNITCWDSFYGQAYVPAGPFSAISSGDSHSCGLQADGTVRCWHWTNELPTGVKWYSGATLAPGDQARGSIQAVYAVPKDGEPVDDRERAIAYVVSEAQQWFRSQTDGRHPIFERNGRSVSVITVRLSQSTSDLDTGPRPGRLIDDIYEDLGAEKSIPLLVIYEGETEYDEGHACGWASSRHILIPLENCSISPGFDGWPTGGASTVAHELTHLLGAVKSCAPNHNDAHVDDDNRDILYLGPLDRDWDNLMLDIGNDDYYQHGDDDCPDINDHPLLVEE